MKVLYLLVLAASINFIGCTKFRCDYKYYKNAGGSLKLHKEISTYENARRVCDSEGATLASLSNNAVKQEMLNILGSNQISEVVATDGENVGKILGRNQNGGERILALENDNNPFICYHDEHTVLTLNDCGTTITGYQQYSKTCFKYNSERHNWTAARNICKQQGGNLAVFENADEINYAVQSLGMNDNVFIGFSVNQNENWVDVSDSKPVSGVFTSIDVPIAQRCGSMNTEKRLIHVKCEDPLPFICEADPSKLICEQDSAPATPAPTQPPTTKAPAYSSQDRITFSAMKAFVFLNIFSVIYRNMIC